MLLQLLLHLLLLHSLSLLLRVLLLYSLVLQQHLLERCLQLLRGQQILRGSSSSSLLVLLLLLLKLCLLVLGHKGSELLLDVLRNLLLYGTRLSLRMCH